MEKTAGRILKRDDVKLEGQFHLEVMKTGSSLPHQGGTALAAPQVRIVENRPEFAVIEITCYCGTAMQLRCEYADDNAAEDSQTQNVK